MKIAKKIAAALLAAAMAFTALVVSAPAESIENTATAITSGKTYSYTFPSSTDFADYKITCTEKGILSFNIVASMKRIYVTLYDSNFNSVGIDDCIATTGKQAQSSTGLLVWGGYAWNETAEKMDVTTKWVVNKGTYYIRVINADHYVSFKGAYSDTPGTAYFTATFPSATAKKAKISYININLAKGSTLSLGATVTNGGTVTWKSSNSSVVTVSSAGSITAKGKGSAIITAKCGSSSKKVKIVVS